MAVKAIKNYGVSVRTKLLTLSKNENQQYQLLLTRYLQERLLYRLSRSRYRDRFLLKGGALLFAYEKFLARPTLDIDFMGTRIDNDVEKLKAVFREICSIPCPEDGVTFMVDTIRTDDIMVERKYPGVNLSLTATLDTVKQDVSIDIGFGDVVTPSPVELDYPTLLEGNEEPNIWAYSVETVLAEKFQTVIERGLTNSRMKDFYDLYTILRGGKYDAEVLREAVAATFANRKTEYTPDHSFFTEEYVTDSNLNTRWNAYVRKLKARDAPTFVQLMAFVQERLRPYWEGLR